ncbi:Surface protein P12p [Dirofilaria immitis]
MLSLPIENISCTHFYIQSYQRLRRKRCIVNCEKVMSEELIKVINFNGFISHVSDSGEKSEFIIYVAHVVSDDSRMQEDSGIKVMQDLFGCKNHVNNNDNNFDNIFTIRVGQCVERVVAKDISQKERLIKVRLIDKGIDVEVERNALFPSTSQAKIDIDCMCPILVVDAGEEQRKIAAEIRGRECRCINGNLVVIPSVGLCVKGRLLISYGNGGYAELKDISLIPTEGQECSKFVVENYNGMLNINRNEDSTFISSRFANQRNNNQFNENSTIVKSSIPFNTKNNAESLLNVKINYYREEMNDIYATMTRPDVPYKQHAFKEYVPHIYPRTMRIRFDKIDSSPADTFWAFEPNIFTTVERVLHEGRQRYSVCPPFDMSLIHGLNGIGCLVRASVDNGYRSLCRAEIIKFAYSTHKFSVYLVDYGFHKWIKYSDVFDISVLNKRDKVLYLPVALLHCRLEKCANKIRLQQFEKGAEYKIIIESRDSKGIFNVHIDQVDNTDNAMTNIHNSVMPVNPKGDSNLFTPWCSCLSLQYTSVLQQNMCISEIAHDNSLMSTVMANNMLCNSWPGICGFCFPCPMIMPVVMPTMANFGDMTNKSQRNRVFAYFGPGDDARNGGPFSLNKNMRCSNSHEQSRYRTTELNREVNYNGDDFGEHSNLQARNAFNQTFNRSNSYCGQGGKRTRSKGRRSRKRNPNINAAGLDEAYEIFPSGPEFINLNKENKSGESIAYAGNSEWDLPSPRNRHLNRLTDFDKNASSE